MDSNERRIEIFAPFGEAYELTRKILFQPFDLKKWFIIGFAAWIATFFSGGGFNYRGFRSGDWRWTAHHAGSPFSWQDMPPWVVPAVAIGGIVGLAILALLLWLNARGRFIFTDCIVRNRAAIAEPWREFRAEGNQFFFVCVVIAICSLVVFGALALLYVAGRYRGEIWLPIGLMVLLGVAALLALVVVKLIMTFMVPVMYRRRCSAMEAFRDVWALIVGRPGVFVLFVLFYILLVVAAAMIGCLAACVTCCIAALPYIGTVILLPVVMVLFSFPLCFIRQFGDQYDVWAVVRQTELPPPPPIPPVQENLPPS